MPSNPGFDEDLTATEDGGGPDFESLEFDVVLRLVSSFARTPPGRAAVSSLRPAFDEKEVVRLLAETSEASAYQTRHGRLPLAGLDDLGPALDGLADAGGAGLPEDFRPIVSAARAAESVRRALAKADGPILAAHREGIPPFDVLLQRAARLFGDDGALRDDASPELAAIRARLRRRRGEVSRLLEKLLDTRREALGDTVVVLRNDRYCLPVQASARGRVPGIVHDRSGSGQTVFVEPLEVIESNNDLALTAAEERREVERLLTEFGRAVLEAAPDLKVAVAALAALDALEAKVGFGELGEGRLPEIADDGTWTLRGARHPLLDARYEKLRRRVLGETREGRDAVPLDLELARDRRLLVVSGPNAGGKTVVLKTAGLLSMLAQSGIPVMAQAGTRLPVFRSIRTEIGDAQAILSDRSTFSSTMETLAEILAAAGTGTLALIDEIGGATDPEEGSALAVAFLEAFLESGGRGIVSTHLSGIKNFAGQRPDAVCAAMEFDEKTGRPTYRLHPGLAGRSRALSVAREQGIPESVLDRARQILGEAWERREKAESDAEQALERLRRLEMELAQSRDDARQKSEHLEAESRRLAEEKSRMLAEGLAGFEKARRELSRKVAEELEAVRHETARLAQASASRILEEAERAAAGEAVLEEARAAEEERSREVNVGETARVRGLGSEGRVVAFDGDWAQLEVRGKRLRVPRADLQPASGKKDKKEKTRARPQPTVDRAASGEPSGPTAEINVIGQRVEESLEGIERALDQALVSGASRLRVIHGHGTGRLRDGIREHFRNHGAVASLKSADRSEGGNGATILELR